MKRNLLHAGFCLLLAALLLLVQNYAAAQTKAAFAPTHAQEEPEKKTVYLTFDDGPSDSTTPYVLDALQAENVPATFFVIGRQIPTRAAIVKRALNEGHALGIHSYSHIYKEIYASEKALLEDIEKCAAALYAATGQTTDLYRFPGGSYNLRSELKNAVSAAGYRAVNWTASCRDAELLHPTADELYAAAVESAAGQNEVVLLLHDSAHRKTTVEVLPRIIRHFKEEGYAFRRL